METYPKYFLFDLDGTLAMSEHVHLLGWRAACKQARIPLMTEAEYQEGIGAPTVMVIESHLKRHGIKSTPELIERLIADKRKTYRENMHLVERNEAVVGLLRAVSPHYKTALVTTSTKAPASVIIEQMGISNAFDVKVFGDEVKHNKPDPECYELAAKLLGARPEECLVFEDSDSGVTAAKRFGAHVVKVMR